jgi:hypothetical protein
MELPALHVIIHSSGNGSTEGVAISYAHKKIRNDVIRGHSSLFKQVFFFSFKLLVCVLDRGTQLVSLPAL